MFDNNVEGFIEIQMCTVVNHICSYNHKIFSDLISTPRRYEQIKTTSGLSYGGYMYYLCFCEISSKNDVLNWSTYIVAKGDYKFV